MTTAVAIALYNGEHFIIKQLESIRCQTKQPEQVILCDDGSRDATVRMVGEYIEKHGLQDRWQLLINERNLGYAANFFHAMEQCRTDLIYLCDQDDIWKPDKIEKMTAVMARDPEILLLSSRHGVIDGEDRPIESLLAPRAKEDESLTNVDMEDVMRSYRWPGMCMCVRADFFRQLLPRIDDFKIPHDMVLAACAADRGGFREYGYIGADHRRHTNNAGGEEHRLWKVLNRERKLWEVDNYNDMLSRLISGKLPLSGRAKDCIRLRLHKSRDRRTALEERSFVRLKQAYTGQGAHLLRRASLLCDIWLITFGDRRK